jgi:energy-coupling factor transporter ATP-binding protein EcfA2
MKIESVYVRNFMGLSEARAKLGTTTLIGGKNGAGKSSLCRALVAALTGSKKSLPDWPIRAGQNEATIEVTTEDGYIIRARMKGEAWRIEVTAGEMAVKAPQTWLSERFGALDGLAFLKGDPKGQAATIRRVAGVDTAEVDARIAQLRAERTEVGRRGKEAAAQAEGMRPEGAEVPQAVEDAEWMRCKAQADAILALQRMHEAETAAAEWPALQRAWERRQELAELAGMELGERPPEPPDLGELSTAAIEATDVAAALERLGAFLVDQYSGWGWTELATVNDAAQALLDLINREAEGINAAETAAKSAAKKAAEEYATLSAALAAWEAKRDRKAAAEAALQADTATDPGPQPDARAARKAADAARALRAYAERALAAAQLREQYAALTAAIQAAEAERAQAMAAASWPVPGLSLSEDGELLHGGVPYAQASHAERMRVSVSVAYALGAPLVVVEEGSALDDDALAMLSELAEASDKQIVIERVGTRDPGAIIIEGGVLR